MYIVEKLTQIQEILWRNHSICRRRSPQENCSSAFTFRVEQKSYIRCHALPWYDKLSSQQWWAWCNWSTICTWTVSFNITIWRLFLLKNGLHYLKYITDDHRYFLLSFFIFFDSHFCLWDDDDDDDDGVSFFSLRFMAEAHCGQNHLPLGGLVIPTQP